MTTGDRCSKCREGQMRVRTSNPCADGERQIRYYTCNRCGHGEKVVVAAERVMRRKTAV